MVKLSNPLKSTMMSEEAFVHGIAFERPQGANGRQPTSDEIQLHLDAIPLCFGLSKASAVPFNDEQRRLRTALESMLSFFALHRWRLDTVFCYIDEIQTGADRRLDVFEFERLYTLAQLSIHLQVHTLTYTRAVYAG